MFWVAWKGYNGGKAVSLGAAAQLQAELYGMHGYPTEQQAEAHPNSVSAFEKLFVNAQLKASSPAQAASSAEAAIAGTTGTAVGACALSVPIIGCILSKTQARALIGGAMIAGGAITGLVGVLLLVAQGFRSSGAGAALGRTGDTLGKVPGLKPAAAWMHSAGGAA